MRRWRLAISDWDGTLFNSLGLVYGSVVEIFATFGLNPPSLETYRNEITADFMKFYWKHGVPQNATGDELNKIRKRHFEKHWQDARLNKGVKEWLEAMRRMNTPVAIVSAEIPEVLTRRLTELELLPLISHVRGGAYLKEEALREVLALFGVNPKDVFYLDDTYDGLMAAKAAGITAIGYNGDSRYNSTRRLQEATDIMVGSIPELIASMQGGPLVVGVMGEKAGGKETFGNILIRLATCDDLSIVRYHFSDILNETLDKWSIVPSRENLQKLAQTMDNAFGKGTLTNAVRQRLLGEQADVVIVDGIRWLTDEIMIRNFPNNLLIYITADVNERYQRSLRRISRAGESEKSLKQFLKEEQASNEIFIPEIGSRADLKIDNSGFLEELNEKAKGCYTEHIKPKLQ